MRLEKGQRNHRSKAFTIVELLIVIVVIGILATIVVVAYTGITRQSEVSVLQADLVSGSKQLAVKKVGTDAYPHPNLPADIQASGTNTFEYTSDGTSFCLTVTSSNSDISPYYISSSVGVTQGSCPGHGGAISNGSLLQTITSANCPTTRIRAVDARDNHTYWVQQMADGKCWMLTNLGYAGGGTDTYGDVKTLANGGSDAATYLLPTYYAPASTTNFVLEPTDPSTSTTGTGHYGYLYNWCAAMGGQTSTSACANATTPAPDTTISVCPAGWRLPTGNTTGEFATFNTIVNSGAANDTDLRSNWFGQRSGTRSSGFGGQGTYGVYWSATRYSSGTNAYNLYISSSTVNAANYTAKSTGAAVRCITV